MKLNRVLQIMSLLLLLFLVVDAFTNIDLAASKNSGLTVMRKREMDTIQNVDTLKHKAKLYLDRIDRKRIDNSNKSTINFSILCFLIFFQIMLFYRVRLNGKNRE